MEKSVTTSSTDFYGLWKGYVDTMFTYVEKTIPQYHQSLTDLFQEYVESWRNVSCSAIDIQKGFANKVGISASMPDAAKKIGNDLEQESKTAIDVQNKIAIASINATKDSLHTMNVNSNEFATLNKDIIKEWPLMIPSRS
ncbi:hypothetical protein [Nitrosopumilus sp. S6]